MMEFSIPWQHLIFVIFRFKIVYFVPSVIILQFSNYSSLSYMLCLNQFSSFLMAVYGFLIAKLSLWLWMADCKIINFGFVCQTHPTYTHTHSLTHAHYKVTRLITHQTDRCTEVGFHPFTLSRLYWCRVDKVNRTLVPFNM